MMKKPEGYDSAQAFTGEARQDIAPGGYICKILKTELEDKPYGQLLRISFDITEGQYKDFYKKKWQDEKASFGESAAKWRGMFYQTIRDDNVSYLKGMITAIEKSNPGFTYAWDEKTLVGKLFGGVFGEEEYETQKGEIRTMVKCQQFRSVEAVRAGVEIPPLKKLKGRKVAEDAPGSWKNAFDAMKVSDDQLPF